MTKLTLNETTTLALKNHFPIELVPGKTEKSHRFHCLINCTGMPELSLVFGDESHGYMFDSAWVSAIDGKLRVKEFDVRRLLEQNFTPERWTREMPLAENPVRIPLQILNSDLGYVRGTGLVLSCENGVVRVKVYNGYNDTSMIVNLVTEIELTPGDTVSFEGTHSLFGQVSDITIL